MAPHSFEGPLQSSATHIAAPTLALRRSGSLLGGPPIFGLLAPLVGLPVVLVCWYWLFCISPRAWGADPSAALDPAMEHRASRCQAEARTLLAQAELQPAAAAQQLRMQGREKFREAGNHHLELATLYFTTRKFADHLWASAMSFVAGRDSNRASAVLKAYLRNEPVRRRPEALVALGKALLTLGKLEDALRSFEECMEDFPRHAITYQARLWGSKAYGEMGQIDAAKQLLESNLADPDLTDASPEWRETLFALGQLLYSAECYAPASEKLADFVRRYPDSADRAHALYLLAQSYRHLATELASPGAEKNSSQRRDFLRQSLQHALEAKQTLTTRAAIAELSNLQQTTLRNVSLLYYDLLMALETQEQIVLETRSVRQRYAMSIVEAEVLVRVAAACRDRRQYDAAERALEEARRVWSELRAEEIEQLSRFSREEWLGLVDHQLSWR